MTKKRKADSSDALVKSLEEYKSALLHWNDGESALADGTPIRSFINRSTPAVRKIVYRAGCAKRLTISPPPAVGGLVMRGVDPFDCIFQGPYGMNMVPTIHDMLDQAIGVIHAGELAPDISTSVKKGGNQQSSNRKVFVVHGRNNDVKETVARFLEKLGLESVVLHERSNRGLTIIEKFEKYADVAFAVVLLTPDDVGSLASDQTQLRSRARQNVVFELGYFMGRLGRKSVCAVVCGDVELPSDSDGILYLGYDPNNAWRLLLAKELKDAGLGVDLNAAV